jgi:RNA polymerase sigma factor (sigma-70 family)
LFGLSGLQVYICKIDMPGAHQLLSDFVRNGSEGAFRELVAGYLDFVYSTALRSLGGDRHLAEDVSQTVFIDLARKAPTLPADLKLGGWLHRHTCFLARKALRREGRRKIRERHAVELQAVADCSDENVAQLTAVLDEVINDLGKEDRTAILLRFFEELDFRSVGKALGSSEDAARMRVTRALEKLGLLLKGRGFVLSTTVLGFVLSAKTASAAPANLASHASTVALASAGKGSISLAMLKEACFTKLNVGLVGAAVVIALTTLFLVTGPSEAKIKRVERRSETPESANDFDAIPITATPAIAVEPPKPIPLKPAPATPSDRGTNVAKVPLGRPPPPLPPAQSSSPVAFAVTGGVNQAVGGTPPLANATGFGWPSTAQGWQYGRNPGIGQARANISPRTNEARFLPQNLSPKSPVVLNAVYPTTPERPVARPSANGRRTQSPLRSKDRPASGRN